MKCREVYNLLPEYSAEALSPRQIRRIYGHLEACSECRRSLTAMNGVMRLVEGAAPVLPPAGLWQAVWDRIEGGEARDGQAPAGWSARLGPWSLLPGVWRLATGAVVAAGLAVVVWTSVGPPVPSPIAEGRPSEIRLTDPELVAAVQQHSLASTEQPFADRAGLESLVQLVRQQREAR